MADSTRYHSAGPRTRDWGGGDDPARRLWRLWQEGQEPAVEDFLAQAGIHEPDQILGVLRVDQWERFRLGQRVGAETYLRAFPAVASDPVHAIDLVFAEYLIREGMGEQPALAEYLERFPCYADELKLQIELHQAMETYQKSATSQAEDGTTVVARRLTGLSGQAEGFPDIPGYEILDVLGRGGMGVVYRAWQKELNRPVALKMLHAGGQADPQILARFRIEAEAVARLRHPHIVQIHDVGQHFGSPFLVLELVEGRSLAQQIAGTPRPGRWAAELVETLARTIHSAHELGVVHRDLTPANVLLTSDGVPKITDFGLAKLIIGGDDLRTQTGDLLGTSSYMSPEQASSRHQVIGPATDVYALGAILYELLAGRPPFKAESPLETLRQVVSDEPVAPSRLRPKLSGDLETICLKCLRKEPSLRYASALELAEDLRRFLDGRPILARPVGSAERLWRWCRRNPAVASLLVIVLGLSVMLAAGSTAAAFWLKGSRDEARLQRNRAEENFREVRQAVDDSFTKVSESALLNAPGMQPLRKQLLADALRYYQGFVRRLSDQPNVQAELAAALDRVAKITSEIGSKEEALGYLRQERGIYQTLAASRPGDVQIRRALARSIAAIALLRAETGRREEAVAEYEQAIGIQQDLATVDPSGAQVHDDLATSESGLGQVLEQLGRREDALKCHQRALDIRERLSAAHPDAAENQRDLSLAYGRIGLSQHNAGREEEAIRFCRAAITIQARLVAAHSEVATYRSSLANTYTLMGVSQAHWSVSARPSSRTRRLVNFRRAWSPPTHPSPITGTTWQGHSTTSRTFSAPAVIRRRLCSPTVEPWSSAKRWSPPTRGSSATRTRWPAATTPSGSARSSLAGGKTHCGHSDSFEIECRRCSKTIRRTSMPESGSRAPGTTWAMSR